MTKKSGLFYKFFGGCVLAGGISALLSSVHYFSSNQFRDKIENIPYIQKSRIENQEKIKFQEKVIEAIKDKDNITGYHDRGFYVDIDGDKNPDASVFYYDGSTRGVFGRDIYKLNGDKK